MEILTLIETLQRIESEHGNINIYSSEDGRYGTFIKIRVHVDVVTDRKVASLITKTEMRN